MAIILPSVGKIDCGALRNKPRTYLLKLFPVGSPLYRQTGKSTTTTLLRYILEEVCRDHKKRLRGRYVHSSKSKVNRRHRLRKSWLDGGVDLDWR